MPKWRVASGEWRDTGIGLTAHRSAMGVSALIILSFASDCRAEFKFDDIEFWVGSGANRAALAIDWAEGATAPPALVWGYRWDGAKKGRDMLLAIVDADDRLYAKFNGTPEDPIATLVYGLGYDADNDGQFGVQGATFDDTGRAYGNAPFFPAAATDPDDYYAEGWTFAFWHYGVESPAGINPFGAGNWNSTNDGMHTRDLVDGSWDGWAFETSTTPPFTAFAENPLPAPSPFPPGDFDRDGNVDADDYSVWKGTFGSTTHPDADANRNGVVDAADYVIWREQFTTPAIPSSATSMAQVPEPTTMLLSIIAVLSFQFTIRNRPPTSADERRFGRDYLRSSASIRGFFSAPRKENV